MPRLLPHLRVIIESDSHTGRWNMAADETLLETAISADIARENAMRLGHSVAQEIKILALHGILHLAGFDHECDNGEMARKEKRLRQQLKLGIGLMERTQPQQGFSKRRSA